MKALTILLAILLPLSAMAAPYQGEKFTADLPVPPATHEKDATGRLGTAHSWLYGGVYQKDKVVVAYSIEVMKAKSTIFERGSAEMLGLFLIKFFHELIAPMAKVDGIEKLDQAECAGGVGFVATYSDVNLYKTKVVVSEPYIWVLNVMAPQPNVESAALAHKIIESFKVVNFKVVLNQ